MPEQQDRSLVDRGDPKVLLPLLERFPEPVVVGFEPADQHVDLHVAPLRDDPRAGAAGLFGLRARPGWSAVGVAIVGRARHMESREVIGATASAAVVVTREGRCASRLRVEGLPGCPPEADIDDAQCGGADGLIVDALHRILDLPSPGLPTLPARMALSLWTHLIAEHLLLEGDVSWEQALALHPGEPGPGPVGPSIEMLVEATRRVAEGFDWEDLRDGTIRGRKGYDLAPEEAEWMDTTMFSRWVSGVVPDPRQVAHLLEVHGCLDVADRIRRVSDALGRPEPAEG